MIWKKEPHVPEVGSTIYGIVKDEKIKRFFEIDIKENTSLAHLEKWCYKEEMINSLNGSLKGMTDGKMENVSPGA